MKKEAMDLFNYYYEETTKGKRPVRRPVLTEEDLKKSSPILGKVLGIEKYQNVIKALRMATKTASSGVVNFVIGRETEVADAILKASFPPGSGIVYKGVDGYSIDAAKWSRLETARDNFLTVMKGGQRVMDMADIRDLREMLKEIPGAIALVEGAPRPVRSTPGQQAPATPRPRGEAGQQPVSAVEDALKQIETMAKVRDQVLSKMRSINRFNEPDHYKRLQQVDRLAVENIKALQSTLPKFQDWLGQSEYDGTGFMDFEYDVKRLSTVMLPITDPEKYFETVRKSSNVQADKFTEESKLKTYKKALDIAVQEVKQISNYASGLIKKSADELLKVLELDAATVLTSISVVSNLSNKLLQSLASQNKVLILNNVETSGLVSRHRGSGEPPAFEANDLVTNEFISKDKRKDRAVVFVSREQINFAFDGVEVVRLSSSAVDAEEGEALISYFVSKIRNDFQKNGKDVSGIRIGMGDLETLNMVLQGKTQKTVLQLLNKAFNEALDKTTFTLDGAKLCETAMDISNDIARDQAADGGKGCYAIKAKIGMDEYVRDRHTDWGKYVEKVNKKVDRSKAYRDRQDILRQKLMDMKDTNAPLADQRILEKRVRSLADKSKSILSSVPRFMILYGRAGCGKSSYAEAFSNKTNFRFFDADFGQTRGGLVGQTETWSKALMDSWKKMANVVIRMDEFDGQVVNSAQEANESFNANVMKNLLSFFQDNEQLLKERNVFIIATTNNPHRIRAQLMDRAHYAEVPEPYNKQGYRDWLGKCIKIVKKDNNIGYIYDPDPDSPESGAEMWDKTETLLKSIDLDKLSEALVGTGMNFRRLKKWVVDAWDAHMRHVESTREVSIYNSDQGLFAKEYPERIAKGDDNVTRVIKPMIEGFPFTTDNLIKAARLTRPRALTGEILSAGQRQAEQEILIEDGIPKLEEELYSGFNQLSGEESMGQMELPLARVKQEDLEDILKPAEPGTVASTDYYFQSLVKAGIVGKDGAVATAAGKPKAPAPVQKSPEPSWDASKVGVYSLGTIMLTPINLKVLSDSDVGPVWEGIGLK